MESHIQIKEKYVFIQAEPKFLKKPGSQENVAAACPLQRTRADTDPCVNACTPFQDEAQSTMLQLVLLLTAPGGENSCPPETSRRSCEFKCQPPQQGAPPVNSCQGLATQAEI